MPVEHPISVDLVTSGTGLIGYAIEYAAETEPTGLQLETREGGMRQMDGWVFGEPHSQQAQTALATVSVVRVGLERTGRRTRVRRGRREHADIVKWARLDARSHISLKRTLTCPVEEAREDFLRARACSVPLLA